MLFQTSQMGQIKNLAEKWNMSKGLKVDQTHLLRNWTMYLQGQPNLARATSNHTDNYEYQIY